MKDILRSLNIVERKYRKKKYYIVGEGCLNKEVNMFNRFFLILTAVALVFSGCSSDSSFSLDSSGEIRFDADVGCKVEKVSDVSVVTTLKTDSFVEKITITVKGDTQENEYYTVYSSLVSADEVQMLCEENKMEASQKNATVECDARSIRIVEMVRTPLSFDSLVESVNGLCREFNAEHPQEIETHNERAICVMQEDEQSVKMSVLNQDSIKVDYDFEYWDNLLIMTTIVTFMPNISQSVVDGACDEAKVNAIESSTTGRTRNVTCDGNVIKIVETISMDMSPIPTIAAEMSELCNTIENKGEFPQN